jgi:hypothetical protein
LRTFAIINAVVAGSNALLWVGFTCMGWSLLKSSEARHVAGYPNRAQFAYYLWFPFAMAVCAVVLYLVARSTRFRVPALLAQVLVFFVLFPFVLAYTGGV